jgi:Flp pilus assembly protein TadG
MIGRLIKFLKDRAGTAAVEFAIVVPVMIIMGAGAFELGHAFQAYDAVNRLATQYAFTWADCSDSPVGTCNTELGYYTTNSSLANIAPQLTTANISLRMFRVTVVGSTANIVYAYPTGATLTTGETSAATTTIANGASGVVVSVSYVYNLAVFSTLMSPVIGSSFTMAFTVAQITP